MDFNLYNSIILAGVVQGFIFAIIVLSTKKYKSISNYYLVAFILSFSFCNLMYYLPITGLMDYPLLFKTFYFPWVVLVPVFFYRYVKTLLYPEDKFSKKQNLQYLPFVVFLVPMLIYKFIAFTIGVNKEVEVLFEKFILFFEVFSSLFPFYFIVAIFTLIIKYKKEHKQFNITEINERHMWLQITMWLLTLLNIVWLVVIMLQVFSDHEECYPVWISVSAIIYWIGHAGIYKYGIIQERKKIRRQTLNQVINTSDISQEENQHVKAFKNQIIKEKLFLDSSITLESIAAKIDISVSLLSRIINEELQSNFNDYVNKLRVEEVKRYLNNPSFSNYTITSIGLEAGFNSKTTFFTAFKKFTGTTPANYKKNLSKV